MHQFSFSFSSVSSPPDHNILPVHHDAGPTSRLHGPQIHRLRAAGRTDAVQRAADADGRLPGRP